MTDTKARQRGISLIEALVAMAIMAFGMLGVLGLQASLRSNSDIAKQRSEAVRIAQAAMEEHRAFSVLDAGGPGTAYASIASAGAASAAQGNANASFVRTETVVAYPTTTSDQDYVARYKSVRVDVGWLDRASFGQNISVYSLISATAPEMTAALSIQAVGSALQNPGGRHRAVPVQSVNLGNGTSRFTPPGAAAGVTWIFSNTTAVIKQLCAGAVCVDFGGALLSGYVRFATGNFQPTAVESETPPDTVALAGVGAIVTATSPAAVVACYTDAATAPNYIAYYCAVPVDSVAMTWSGRSTLTGLTLAADASDGTATAYRVCRYTPSRWNTATPVVANLDHPIDYSLVSTPLTNQNFLVIKAGSAATSPFACPDDSNVLGRTFNHQPQS